MHRSAFASRVRFALAGSNATRSGYVFTKCAHLVTVRVSMSRLRDGVHLLGNEQDGLGDEG
jgi:hypothetical protein